MAVGFEVQVWKRGRTYFRQGRVWHRLRWGERLEARVIGSEGERYQVGYCQDSGEGFCTCPAGAFGRCKHVAAVVRAFEEAPDEFLSVTSPRERLAEVPPEERELIEASFEARLLAAWSWLSPEPDWVTPAVKAISRLLNQGSSKAEGLFRGVLAEIRLLPREARLRYGIELARMVGEHEYGGYLVGQVPHFLRELEAWPGLLRTEQERLEMAEVAYRLYRLGLLGLRRLSEVSERVLFAAATPEVADRVASEVYQGLERADRFEAEALSRLYERLLVRAGEGVSRSLKEKVLLQGERYRELAELWQKEGETERALDLFSRLAPGELPGLVEAFLSQGRAGEAYRALLRREELDGDPDYLFALMRAAEAVGDCERARDVASRLYAETGTLDYYRKAAECADRVGGYEAWRRGLRDRLLAEGQPVLAFELDLIKGDLESALALWPRFMEALRWEWGLWDVVLGRGLFFLDQLIPEDPANARRVALELVDWLAGFRQRGYYRKAAEVARRLYEALSEPERRELVCLLHERYRQLRAFRDELRKAGLDGNELVC